MKKILLAALLFLVGCAPYASNISPSPISSARYDGWPCDKLRVEQRFVEESLTRVSADQDSAAGNDILMVFLIGVPTSGGGVKGEVARLKGEQIALHHAMLQANCLTPAQTAAATPTEPVAATTTTQSQVASATIVSAVTSKPSTTPSVRHAWLFLTKGPIVSDPPQRFSADFYDNGKAAAVLSGIGPVSGDYQIFGINESIAAKYTTRLINPDNVKPQIGADAKGFAALSNGTGIELECSFMFSKATGRGEGMCADNQRSTYRLVFD
jgi:hypothetical protein